MMDNLTAFPPIRAVRVYPFRTMPANNPPVSDERTLEESHPATDDNAVNEWAEILAAEAPTLNDQRLARLRRLFDVRRPGVRG